MILLVHYDENSVVGLVLNRRTDVPLSQVLDLKAAKDRSDPVYIGGPLEPSAAIALFQSSAKIEKAENIFGGVYLISDKDLFEKTLSAQPNRNTREGLSVYRHAASDFEIFDPTSGSFRAAIAAEHSQKRYPGDCRL